jgi:hypothetical protein
LCNALQQKQSDWDVIQVPTFSGIEGRFMDDQENMSDLICFNEQSDPVTESLFALQTVLADE